jgi:SAM-dependent methyltransferase
LQKSYKLITNCRICDSSKIDSILNLGNQPLANALREIDDFTIEIYIPLEIIRCNICTTVQLSVNVEPDIMFKEYLWVTGTTKTATDHLEKFATLISNRCTKRNPSLLEVGSNDGSLLKILKNRDFGQLYGVDPAKNIVDSINESEIIFYTDFFNYSFTKSFTESNGNVDIVVARNVFSHVPDLVNCLKGVANLLAEDGLFVVEFHEATKILTELHYDSIYHEHTFYHSIKSISEAAKIAELQPFDIEISPISGGSLILFFSKKFKEKTINLIEHEIDEINSGVLTIQKWEEFAVKSLKNIEYIREYLNKNSEKRLCGFGASARSSTLVNAIGSECKNIIGIADNNPLKQGKMSPGIHLQIEHPKKLISSDLDIVIVFPFNFEEEIISYLRNILNWSGEVYLPLPNTPRVIKI